DKSQAAVIYHPSCQCSNQQSKRRAYLLTSGLVKMPFISNKIYSKVLLFYQICPKCFKSVIINDNK
ncbi:hypothetical protein, partial [Psychrobacter sp.]|uniref:hypothetical protein n=1 Tax=Psychrobacter sp. TaxID=56811 RepID=UPI002FDAB5BC